MSKKRTSRSESSIQREIFEYLERLGAKVWVNTPATMNNMSYTAQGIPDISGVLPGGKHIVVEVKKNKSGRVSGPQKNHLVMTLALGGEAWVVYEENLEEFKQYMDFMYGLVPKGDKARALMDAAGMSTAKNGDIPGHVVASYLTKKRKR